MTFLLESLAACALFTLLVYLMSRDPVKLLVQHSASTFFFRIWGVVTWVIKKV